jgi:hypothetical protein
MIPPDTTHGLVEVIRGMMVPVVTGTSPSTLGAPLSMDFSMTDAPPASHNENHVHSWLQDIVEAHQILMEKSYAWLRRTSEQLIRLLIC